MKTWGGYAALLAMGAVLDFVVRLFPADLPVWMPWEFSWPIYLATALSLAWFVRGLKVLPKAQHPPLWRSICFVAGVLSFWVVLQTRIDYYAQHMFFVHRAAHFVLHHFGAFFIALGMTGPVLWAGLPDFLKPLTKARPVQAALSFLQNPVMAPFLFVGLLYFWLIPQIHTRVMLDAKLYEVMNWTMATNGVMFWSIILASGPKPPARLSHLMRAALILVIELPQMVLGAILSLTEHDIYPVYMICGRVLDMTALNDQHYGGFFILVAGAPTPFAAVFVGVGAPC